jgi:putative colanic acid biosynthesis UDP-glucose lipid carrier transferase
VPLAGQRDPRTGEPRSRRGLDALLRLIREDRIDAVIVALPVEAQSLLPRCLEHLRACPVDLWVLPVGGGGSAGLVEVARRPLTGWRMLAKTALDRALAGALLLLLAPLMVLIAVAIRLDSPGPALFRQWRGGRSGVPFEILKFRTMRVTGEAAPLPAAPDDRRVTRLGRLLRRTSLDELPQLLNVLKGEMSLVGPRPHALAHDRLYARLLPDYAARYRVRPGITGLAQVEGLRGEPTSLAAMAARLSRDLAYIDGWSLGLDLRLLLRTLRMPLGDPRAY